MDAFVPFATNVTFEPLQFIGNITIEILSDRIPEPAEQLTLILQSYEEEVQLSADKARATIEIISTSN